MRTMIIRDPHRLTRIEIWQPKWSGKYEGEGERVILPAVYKVDAGSPILLFPITKYPPYANMRLCMPRNEVQNYPKQFNGKEGKGIECYRIPWSDLYIYDTVQEVKDIAFNLFD